MESEQNHIPELSMEGIAQPMLDLGRRLADTKYHIDLLGKNGWADITGNLHGLEASGEWNGPDDALTFFSKIVPFASLPAQTEPMGVFRVPVERVIGRSWHWWPEHLNHSSETRLLEHLTGPLAAEGTSYYFIPALGLLLAAQGQSRVYYCRQRHIPFITARVSHISYPPAERFRLYAVSLGETRQHWVVMDGRYLQPVQWPRITVPALTTYGVHVESWPSAFPPIHRVFDALHTPSAEQDFILHCVDLQALNALLQTEQAEVEQESQPVKMALSEMDISNIWPVGLTLSLIFILALLVAGLTVGAGWAGSISLLVCGMAGSVLLFMALPIFLGNRHLRRRMAENDAVLTEMKE